MEKLDQDKMRQEVKERYEQIALAGDPCCASECGSADRIGLATEIRAFKPREAGKLLDAKEMKEAAYRHFGTGLHCAEVISRTLLEHFLDEPRPDMVRAASAFGGGIAGTTRELCGAFTGGVLTLGFLTGRSRGGETLKDCSDLTRAFSERFRQEFGSLECPALLAGFAAEDQARGCARLTARSAVMLAELLEAFEREHSVDLSDYRCRPRESVPTGACPFGGPC